MHRRRAACAAFRVSSLLVVLSRCVLSVLCALFATVTSQIAEGASGLRWDYGPLSLAIENLHGPAHHGFPIIRQCASPTLMSISARDELDAT